jgi:hypothetical protein
LGAPPIHLLPPPAFGKGGHRRLARRLIAMGWRAAFVVREDQRPHPRRSYWRCIGLEDATDNGVIRQHVEVIVIPLTGGAGRRALAGSIDMREGLKSTSTKLFFAFRSEPAAGRTIRINPVEFAFQLLTPQGVPGSGLSEFALQLLVFGDRFGEFAFQLLAP